MPAVVVRIPLCPLPEKLLKAHLLHKILSTSKRTSKIYRFGFPLRQIIYHINLVSSNTLIEVPNC